MLGPDLVLVWNLLLGFTKEGKAPRSHTKLPSDYFNDYLQRATQTTGARCVLTETIQCKHRFYTHLCESSTAADEWEQVGLGFSLGGARVELVSKDRKMIQGAVSCKQHVRTNDDSHTDRRLYVLKSSETRSFIYVWLYINLWATDDAPLHTRNCCIWKYSFVQLDLTFVKMFGLIVWYLCFSLNAKTRFVGISPGVRFTSQGLNYSSYTIKLHKVPPGGDKTLHWGSCTATQTQRRDHWRLCWMGRGPITRRIFPPGCSRTRRGQTWSPGPSRTCSGTQPWKKKREECLVKYPHKHVWKLSR